jgi:hypothetical protein
VALLKDEAGRERVAPTRRRLPKPQADDGPRAETRREGSRRPVQQQSLPARSRSSRTPAEFSYPFWGELLGIGPQKPEGPKKPELPIEMPEHWKPQVGASGQPADVLRGVLPDVEGQRNDAQIVQNVADQMNVKAAIGRRDQMRMDREAKDRQEVDKVLTPKEWAKLSPMQQAAVQANYDLSQAIRRDFATQSKHSSTDEQFGAHQARVKELFGEDGSVGFKGLEYAPNTIAFLDSRGLEASDLAGRTLDDLVSGDALVDMDTVTSLGAKVSEWGPGDQRGKNIAFAQSLAKGQLAYQEELAAKLKKGEQLLAGVTTRSTDATTSYGALEDTSRLKLDKVRPETMAQFDIYMEALARTDSPLDKALEAISLDLSQRGATNEEVSQVWQGMIDRSRAAMTGEGQWFDGVDFPMRSPVEVAQALGAPTLKRQLTGGVE